MKTEDETSFIFKFDMEAFIPRKKGCLLDCLDWMPNRGTCIDSCLSCDVTRCFRLHDIKTILMKHNLTIVLFVI